jgi:ribosome-binding factor A
MPSRRLLKAAEAIREVVSMAILTELKDPRVKNVTVTSVEVLPDMKQARVYVTIMGDEKQQRLTLRGLQNSAGFLQHKIADRIETRYTPRLEFIFDEGVKNALEIDRILKRVLPKDSDPSDDARPLAIDADTINGETEDADADDVEDREAAGSVDAFPGDDRSAADESAADGAPPENDDLPRDPPVILRRDPPPGTGATSGETP